MRTDNQYDVIIIGGSYAGLSAAMSLGRSLQKVLVIDSGKPCNRQTPHSHNFLTQDGQTPAAIAALGKAQVAAYATVSFLDGLAIGAEKTTDGFSVTTEAHQLLHSKRLIIATGLKDELPNLPGFAECWGISLVHCPYCHGYEFHGRPTAIIGNGDGALHHAQLVSNLTKNLALFTNGPANFTEEQLEKLHRNNIPVIETAIDHLRHNAGMLTHIVLTDGSEQAFDAAYLRPVSTQHSTIPAQLGCTLNEQGLITVTPFQLTSIPGVFACGDNCSMGRSVAGAVAAGAMAGAFANHELTAEVF